MTTRTTLKPQVADYAHLEPLPDPPREPDMRHNDHLVDAQTVLKVHFAGREDVLVSGQGYLRHEPYNDAERLAPDCVVAFGVNPAGIVSRNGYVISEVGKPPDFVLEVASRSTGRRDYTVKREGYAGYGVTEYWRFDHTGGRFHAAALAGDVLVGGRYQPVEVVEEPGGLKWGASEVLGLHLCWDDGELRFRDPATLEFLPTALEIQAAREAERAARVAAEARVAELEAEIERLRSRP